MKKQLFTVLSLLMLCIGIQAQTNIANYTFASSAGTYVPLSAGASTLFAGTYDNQVSAAIPLGGNFTYGTVTYTACFVSANGYITFGSAPGAANYTPMSAGTFSGAISAFGQDAGGSEVVGATPKVSYENIGGATGEFVVQYADHANYFGRSTERLNFQIRLNLATGAINIVYGSWTAPSAAAAGSGINPEVGIRGNSTTWTSNVNSLYTRDIPTGTSCNWSNAVTSNANSSSMLFSSGNANITPTNGLTYTWAPPVNATLAPVRTFTAVTGIATNSAVIAWTAPTGAVQYNVQYRTPGTCSWTNFSGNPVAATTATLTGLTQATIYQVRVQSNDGGNNAIWSHIPNAAGTGNGYAAAGTFSTLPTCPATSNSTVTAIGSNSAVATWTVNGTETAWDIYYGPAPLTAPTATTVPTATSSTNSFTLTGLIPVTGYSVYVRANCGAGDMSTWAGPRAFTTTALTTDLQTLGLNAPAVNATGCYGSSIPVVIQLKNVGSTTLDFTTNTATILTAITGVNPQSFTTTINTGTLAANATLNVTVTSTYNMSAAGVYTINASSTLATPDANTANDAMAMVTRTATAATPAPYFQDFAAGTLPAGWLNPSSWSIGTGHGVTNNGIYYNLYGSAGTATPRFDLLKLGTLTGAETIAFDFRVLNYSGTYPGTVVPPTNNWGSLQVQVSTDCGATFTTIATINNTNHTVTTQAFTNKAYSLAAYAGQNVTIRFLGTYLTGDYFIDIDNINIASCFAPTAVTSTSITQTGATIAWTAPTNGTPASYNYEIRTSGAAGSGATGLVASGNVAAPTTSVTVTTLTAFTGYSVYVQSNCGGSDVSFWTPATTFTTLANCQVPTGVSVAFTPTTAVATWTAGGTETAWDVYYGPTPLVVPTATTVATATTSSTTYTLTGISPSTGYAFYVRANCGAGNMSIWTPVSSFTTPCLPPNVLTTNGSTRCGIGTTTLTATGDVGASLQWYANPTGGSAIASGTLFTTPTITNTTNYYVTATGGLTTANVGMASTTGANGTNTAGAYLIFDAFSAFTLNTVDIYPSGSGAGTVVIALQNSAGVTLQTATVAATGNATAIAQTVNVNFNITPGTAYRLNYLSSTGGVTAMYRETGGASYPYTVPGVVSITDGSLAGYYYYFYNWSVSTGCESARTMVTATVTAPPALTFNSPTAICAGSGIATLNVTSTVSDYDSYTWTPTTGLFLDAAATVPYTGTASTVYVNTVNDGVLNYNINASNSVSGCATSASASVTIKPAPTTITLTANANPVCAGSTVSLSATPNALPVTLLTENFNGATNSWTTLNASTGGTATASAWTLQTSPYTSNVGTGMSSNDASQFYLTDSDLQGNGGTTSTILQSPAINTTGLATLSLGFYHYYNYWNASDAALVQVSTNGTTWTTVQNYSTGAADIGTAANFANASINLNAYVGNATLYVRYNYGAVWGYGWAIDNVRLSGTTINEYSYAWTSTPAAFTASTSSTTDMPTANTTYSVVITNTATSCSNSSSVAVTVNALPTVTAATSSASVCAGNTVTLTAGGATNYTWSPATSLSSSTGSIVSSNATTTTAYTVTGEALGCSNTATVSVGVNPLPTVTAMSSQTLLCDDGSTGPAILTASTTATNYLWSDGAMTMTTSVTPTVTTTYTVTATELGCSADAFVTIIVSNCTGINAITTSANGISVYPNPTNGILNIAISSELAGTTSIEVYDAIGKLVIKETLSTDTSTINTSKLTDGIYVFKVINNNKAIKIGKIVKQ
jgi:hypothetical protein